MKFVGPKGTATLVLEVLAITTADPETIAQTFEVSKQLKQAIPSNAIFHTVVAGEPLSVIAKKY